MALRTLCRDGDFTAGRLVDGEVLFDSPQHLERRARVDRLLKYLNGDWRCDQMYHHCVPGVCDCGTEAEARERIFAALMENSATLGSNVSPPSKNRRFCRALGPSRAVVLFLGT